MSVPDLRSIGDYETAAQLFNRLTRRQLNKLGLPFLPCDIQSQDCIEIISEKLVLGQSVLHTALCCVISPTSCGGLQSSALLLTTDTHFDAFGFTDILAQYIHDHTATDASQDELQALHQAAMKRLYVTACCSELELLAATQAARSLCLKDSSVCMVAVDTLNAWLPVNARQLPRGNKVHQHILQSLKGLISDFDLAAMFHTLKDTSKPELGKQLPIKLLLRTHLSSSSSREFKVDLTLNRDSKTFRSSHRLPLWQAVLS
eukprot:m.21232 g.21232  ORF g.21232 m.21232 type:complete len:260 (-) comp11118_c0_seq1:47-826(-)